MFTDDYESGRCLAPHTLKPPRLPISGPTAKVRGGQGVVSSDDMDACIATLGVQQGVQQGGAKNKAPGLLRFDELLKGYEAPTLSKAALPAFRQSFLKAVRRLLNKMSSDCFIARDNLFTDSTMNTTFAELVGTCPVQGNGDLYGLGIRIGLYLQIFTAQISGMTSQLLEVDDNIGHAVVIFVLAAGTVLFRLILRREIEAVEVFPILSLLIVQLVACRVPFWKKPTTIFLYLGESVGLLALSTWFWFRGMDTLPRSCVDDYAFFVVKVSIWNWFRKLNKAFTIISVVGGAPVIIFYISGKPTGTIEKSQQQQ
jgi:hypothetical protein